MTRTETYKWKKELKRKKKLHKTVMSKHFDTLNSEERRSVRTQLTIKQDGCCAICGEGEKEVGRTLCIDHCHIKGHIRGLLCHNCNFLIGFAKDNPNMLNAAVRYLNEERVFV